MKVPFIRWEELTGAGEASSALEDVRCWLRAAQKTRSRDTLGVMFRVMLEPFFNPSKLFKERTGHAIYRIGELVPEHQRHTIVVGEVTLAVWMEAWSVAMGERPIHVMSGDPPQLPG